MGSRKYTIVLVLLVVGVFMFAANIKDFVAIHSEPVDLMKLDNDDWDDLEPGTHIVTKIDIVWDCFYSETTTETSHGVTTRQYESSRGYLIPNMIDYGDDCDVQGFIGYQTKSYSTIEKMIEESNDWYSDWSYEEANYKDYCHTKLPVEGILRKMSDDEYKLLLDYFKDMEYDFDDPDEWIYPYMIEEVSPSSVNGLTFLSIGLILGAVVILILIINSGKKNNKMVNYSAGVVVNDVNMNTQSSYEPNNTYNSYDPNAYGTNNGYTTENTYENNTYGSGTTDNSGINKDMFN